MVMLLFGIFFFCSSKAICEFEFGKAGKGMGAEKAPEVVDSS